MIRKLVWGVVHATGDCLDQLPTPLAYAYGLGAVVGVLAGLMAVITGEPWAGVGLIALSLAGAGMWAHWRWATPSEPPTDVIGPHVIRRTEETTTCHYNGREKDVSVWTCKYCDWDGPHPDEFPVWGGGLSRDCDGVKWLDSEDEAFQAAVERRAESLEANR